MEIIQEKTAQRGSLFLRAENFSAYLLTKQYYMAYNIVKIKGGGQNVIRNDEPDARCLRACCCKP